MIYSKNSARVSAISETKHKNNLCQKIKSNQIQFPEKFVFHFSCYSTEVSIIEDLRKPLPWCSRKEGCYKCLTSMANDRKKGLKAPVWKKPDGKNGGMKL